MKKRNQISFQNHACTLKIKRLGGKFYFGEYDPTYRPYGLPFMAAIGKYHATYEKCVRALQKYSRLYYGEESK